MPAQYILGALAILFLTLGTLGAATGRPRPQPRTWLLVGAIFAVVSLWLFART
jgi:hypothetical protein